MVAGPRELYLTFGAVSGPGEMAGREVQVQMSFGELADVLGAVPAAYTTAYDPEMAGAYEAVMRDLRGIVGEVPS